MKRLLVIAKVLPEPASSAAGFRMLQLLELFRHQNWDVHLATAAQATEHSEDAITMGFPLYPVQVNDPGFEKLLLILKPDAVLFDRFMTEEQFGWKVSEHCPDALKILDTEDLHGLRAAREIALRNNRPFVLSDLQNPVFFREAASIWRCDLSLIISEFEIQLLQDSLRIPDYLLHYLPFLTEEPQPMENAALPSYKERKHFLSIGNFLHAPNLDAVSFLHRKIWPLIRKKLPEAQLHVYGAYMPDSVKQLHSMENGFLTLGRALDVNRVMREVKLNLAPLRFGAGLKGKVFDALRNSTPSICSSIAAEGMGNELPSGYLVEDDVEKFSDLAVTVYQDENKWNELSAGCGNTLQRFRRKNFDLTFFKVVNQLMEDIHKHRERNFTGAMLQHHAFYSTKYMGLWIEAKNKGESNK